MHAFPTLFAGLGIQVEEHLISAARTQVDTSARGEESASPGFGGPGLPDLVQAGWDGDFTHDETIQS